MSSHALLSSNSKLPLVEKKFLFHGHYLNILSKKRMNICVMTIGFNFGCHSSRHTINEGSLLSGVIILQTRIA